ncbi:hypothetical protein Bca4012_052788 [Brassica carinata]
MRQVKPLYVTKNCEEACKIATHIFSIGGRLRREDDELFAGFQQKKPILLIKEKR